MKKAHRAGTGISAGLGSGTAKEHLHRLAGGLFLIGQVILRCSIEGMSDEVYVLGEDDGFLAVFYEDGKKQLRLKERTELPLSALPDGEARQLQEGCASSGRKIWRRCLRILCHKEFLIRRFYCKRKL